MKKRVGPTFSISPLIIYSEMTLDDYLEETLTEEEIEEMRLLKGKSQIIAFGSLERVLLT